MRASRWPHVLPKNSVGTSQLSTGTRHMTCITTAQKPRTTRGLRPCDEWGSKALRGAVDLSYYGGEWGPGPDERPPGEPQQEQSERPEQEHPNRRWLPIGLGAAGLIALLLAVVLV